MQETILDDLYHKNSDKFAKRSWHFVLLGLFTFLLILVAFVFVINKYIPRDSGLILTGIISLFNIAFTILTLFYGILSVWHKERSWKKIAGLAGCLFLIMWWLVVLAAYLSPLPDQQ